MPSSVCCLILSAVEPPETNPSPAAPAPTVPNPAFLSLSAFNNVLPTTPPVTVLGKDSNKVSNSKEGFSNMVPIVVLAVSLNPLAASISFR